MTFHKLQHCSGGQYSYGDYGSHDKENKKQIFKAAKYDELELSYKNQLNIIVENICHEYCSRYNKMYAINFIKPSWFMIFEFAADEH